MPVNVSKVFFEANLNGTSSYVNYTGVTNVTNWNKNITMYNDTYGNYWINFTDLPARTYYYRWILNDTNNIWFSTNLLNYLLNPFSVTLSLGISGSSFSITQIAGQAVTIICSATSYQLNLSLTGGCSATGGNSVSCSYTPPSTVSGNTLFYCDNTNPNFTAPTAIGTLSYAPFTTTTSTTTTTTTTTTGSFTITPSASSLTIEPGSSKFVTFTLLNTLTSGDIISINITASGVNSSWYNLDKVSIARIRRNGNDTIRLTLNVPNNAERKNYSITVTAAGKDFNLNSISRLATITLTVPQEQAQQNVTVQNVTGENITAPTTSTATGTSPTGLSISPEDLRNVFLLFGLLAAGLIFIFRDKITYIITRGRAGNRRLHPSPSKPEIESKKPFSGLTLKINLIRKKKINKQENK